jgi:hypothetical protein
MEKINGTKYWITKDGTVLRNGIKPLKPEYSKKGYQRVTLSVDGKVKKYFIHRLIAITYIPNPNNLPFVNHKNFKRDDNNVSNLEWITTQDNNRYRKDFTKMNLIDASNIRKDLNSTNGILAKKYNVSKNTISQIRNNKIWN